MAFAPIAIVGRACVLPGALSPEALWQALSAGRDLLSTVPEGLWGMPKSAALGLSEPANPDQTWSDRGGYVRGFEQVWDPNGFAIDAGQLTGLDPLVHWLLHSARAALRDAGVVDNARTGAIFGNLGFPSPGMAEYAHGVWSGRALGDPRNRFVGAGSADILARALALGAGSVSLDAACASSLYAIKLACDQLHDGLSDVMLAGAVQGADDLFLHVGFCALNALSRTGQSRPFHRDADGLVPASGAAFVVLKRLADARRAGDTIHGVIRGIGLSNDGRGKGLLAPAAEGQQRAMRAAYQSAGFGPERVSLIECHATGTPVGDATELRSTGAVYAGLRDVPIGSLKSNMGHPITVAGVAGLIKLTEAMRAGQRPPSLHADLPSAALLGSPFRLVQHLEAWPSDGPRIAALSAFGFGGNNAHLLLSEDSSDSYVEPSASVPTPLAIVGLGCMAASAATRAAFSEALFAGAALLDSAGEGRIAQFDLDLEGVRFPPKDLAQSLPQQLALLQVAREALAETSALPRERTGIFIGMEPDPEVARYGTRWRLAGDQAERDAVVPALTSAAVLGCMPNIPANRLSAQFDLAGPAFTIQAGPASGLVALQIAARALRCGELDAALVGAVDFSCEPVQRSVSNLAPGDAAVLLVVKRLSDAQLAGDRIYALLAGSAQVGSGVELALGEAPGVHALYAQFGQAFAASGLLHVAAAALALQHRRRLDGKPWLADAARHATVQMAGADRMSLHEYPAQSRRAERAQPRLRCFAGADKAGVIAALQAGQETLDGPARLVLVSDDERFSSLRTRALAHLEYGAPAGAGVYFSPAPVTGELAFVFAGAGAGYHGMSRDLLLQMPQLLELLRARSTRLPGELAWAFGASDYLPSATEQLWAASTLSQLHLELSTRVLGLRPDAWLGYSSGETNALFGAGIWRDADALMTQTEQSRLMSHELGGDFAAVARAWGSESVDWASWTVLVPLAELRAVLANHSRVHLAIIQSDNECLIAGDAAQCQAVVNQLGTARCLQLRYPLAVHVPELREVAAEWLQLHQRATTPLTHGRIYSNAWGSAYQPTQTSCAEAILQQATGTLDLRPAVLQAWQDGVRIFVEHGPGTSYARAIRSILGDRNAVIVSLDAKGRELEGTLGAVAALLAAGVPVDLAELEAALPSATLPTKSAAKLSVPAHPAPVVLKQSQGAQQTPVHMQIMAPAPALPPVLATPSKAAPVVQHLARSEPALVEASRSTKTALLYFRTQLAQLGEMQQQFVQGQARIHQQFLSLRQSGLQSLLAMPSFAGVECVQQSVAPTARPMPEPVQQRVEPARLALKRAQLEVHAGGQISELFGPAFAAQDAFRRQVRMPLPPLLLADRVSAIDADPGSMGLGTIYTETDVQADAWYLHQGYMPAGILIEAGQADLLLISYLGVDLLNRGERVYRLLGCELTYHGDLPRAGELLKFAIHVDGHAAQGDLRLMFFHYQCANGERKQLTVRNGQAGFFSDAELAESAGCLWRPETQSIIATPRLDAPEVPCASSFSSAQLQAFARGDTYACFGAGFERAQTHTRSPAIQSGAMLLLDQVTELASRGGPWQRGYLRAELAITPEQWFFAGHFKNDPCMPGTLMFEACLQAMAFYLAAQGFTLLRDGWRFQPVPELPYQLQCRGQVTPSSKLLVTEVFVEELSAGPLPTVYADLLCTVDGLKAFHARRVALQLVPDWPMREPPAAYASEACAQLDGFRFDQRSLLACAQGRPSEAFGPIYRRFDAPMRVARLPSPPYLFMSRIREIHGPIGEMRAGAKVIAEYDIPPDAWYFAENGARTMPFAVLLEAALQPCGWLSSYIGSALTVDSELGFRNLDGKATLHTELLEHSGTLSTHVEITDVSATAGMIIESFEVRCFVGEREIYSLSTVFGFFPPQALAAQAGLRTSEAEREILQRSSDFLVDLQQRPQRYFAAHGARLAQEKLLMIDRVDGWWPACEARGIQVRAVKDIDASLWFFKAHFFQDPVQPGSLGLEAMLQTLQFFMLHMGMAEAIAEPRFVPIELRSAHQWKYRGQVLPHHKQVHTTLEILAAGSDANGSFARARGSLWADGKRIYEVPELGMRIVSAVLDV